MASRFSDSRSCDAVLSLLFSSGPTEIITPTPAFPQRLSFEVGYWVFGIQSVSHGVAKSSALLAAESQDLCRVSQDGIVRIMVSLLSFCDWVARLCFLVASSLSRRHCPLYSLFCRFLPVAGPLHAIRRQSLDSSGHSLGMQPCGSSGIAPAFTNNRLDSHQI